MAMPQSLNIINGQLLRMTPKPNERLALSIDRELSDAELASITQTLRHWRGYGSPPVLILTPSMKLVSIADNANTAAHEANQKVIVDDYLESVELAQAEQDNARRDMAAEVLDE